MVFSLLAIDIFLIVILLYLTICFLVILMSNHIGKTIAASSTQSYLEHLKTIFIRPHRWSYLLRINYFYSRTNKLYFCGYNLEDLIIFDVFRELAKSNQNQGFCWELSALVMLAINHKKAKLVYGDCLTENGEYTRHRWVELPHSVIDPAWYTPPIISKKRFYIDCKPQIIWTCDQKTFQNFPPTQFFKEKTQAPDTSYVFKQLLVYTRDNSGTPSFLGNSELFARVHQYTDGKTFLPVFITDEPITQAIFDQAVTSAMSKA